MFWGKNYHRGIVRTTAQGILIVGALLISVVACTPNRNANLPLASSSSAPPGAAPQRIVALIPSLTETACDLGLSQRLVAITANDDYPPEILHLPKVGDMNPNWEKLIEVAPDAVLIDNTTISPPQQERLRQLHLPTINTHIVYLHDLVEQLPQLGEDLHCAEQAELLRQEIQNDIGEFQRIAATMERHPRVYIDVYNTPLLTAGKPSLLNELLTIAGGENIYGDQEKAYPQVSAEELLTRNPDIVVLTSMTAEQAKNHPQLSQLPAIRQDRAIAVPASLMQRPTKRCLQSVKLMQDYFVKWSETALASVNDTQKTSVTSPPGDTPENTNATRATGAVPETANVTPTTGGPRK